MNLTRPNKAKFIKSSQKHPKNRNRPSGRVGAKAAGAITVKAAAAMGVGEAVVVIAVQRMRTRC